MATATFAQYRTVEELIERIIARGYEQMSKQQFGRIARRHGLIERHQINSALEFLSAKDMVHVQGDLILLVPKEQRKLEFEEE